MEHFFGCCTLRGADGSVEPATAVLAGSNRVQTCCDDDQEFFDCIDVEATCADMHALADCSRSASRSERKDGDEGLPPRSTTSCEAVSRQAHVWSILKRAPNFSTNSFSKPKPVLTSAKTDVEVLGLGDLPECTETFVVNSVLEETRQRWRARLEKLELPACTEVEWMTPATARRMLRACVGRTQEAVDTFLQALECRACDMELFANLRCDVPSDLRVVAHDRAGHPVMLMCTAAQSSPMRCVKNHIVATLEKACRSISDEGSLVLVLDMYGFKPSLNMDMQTLKHFAHQLSTVFAGRIHSAVIIDFSTAAQAAWWVLRPLLHEATRKKFHFVSRSGANNLLRSMLDDIAFERVSGSLDKSRDPGCTEEDLMTHAMNTSLIS
eukprot:TRINITY_DN27177_c0_g1_i1.p1 TRINITY_DN27177_c0_g1~~TRINITY_DN27177_c0_g1_i1.p1  ORF type:complete len:382 (-),score=71.21 TRINITY_DN27177_c0_g1_i1:303-1448(-)